MRMYTYRDAGTYAAKIASGTLVLTDMYGFWLPLYQLICALFIAVVGHPYYVSKLVSAVFGIGICLLVYEITLRLTAHHKAALCAFALIALNPLHIFNSASSMTDIPSAFFVTASLYFALKKRWVLGAVFAALAGMTRVDNWMLIVLLPVLLLFEERRVSIVSIAITDIPANFLVIHFMESDRRLARMFCHAQTVYGRATRGEPKSCKLLAVWNCSRHRFSAYFN